jgi:hypothetical protein
MKVLLRKVPPSLKPPHEVEYGGNSSDKLQAWSPS